MEKIKCLYCKKKTDKFNTNNKEKKFCSPLCRTRFNANETWIKTKDTPEAKLKNYEKTKKWISENRGHFNDLMRDVNKLRARKIAKERKLKNLCRRCGDKLINMEYNNCEKCRKKFKEYEIMRKE